MGQLDIVAYSFVEKRVIAVIDTSGNYEKVLYHPQDPEEPGEVWNHVNRYAMPIFLERFNECHYMLLIPKRFPERINHYFFVKVSERLYLSKYNSAQQQMLIDEGAMLDRKQDRLYVETTQLWNPIFTQFGPGSMTQLQSEELARRTSTRSYEESVKEQELELGDMDNEELGRLSNSKEIVDESSDKADAHDKANKVSLSLILILI
jgi:hypothetical protein